mmetsp:Transcript_27698/g.67404  ORF Transcript_27698/g.67404 Transcript_27698/m.67404 type:complete len:1151 (-) Transcript_27698:2621-6073(-)
MIGQARARYRISRHSSCSNSESASKFSRDHDTLSNSSRDFSIATQDSTRQMGLDNDSSTDFDTPRGPSGWASRRRKSKDSEYDLKPRTSQEVIFRLEELSINKLDYDAVGMVGREHEQETTEASLNRMIAQKDSPSDARSKEAVFIKGPSGVGKSMLASSLKPSVEKSGSGFFVRGKFDLNRVDEPYSAVASAFGDLCHQIKSACDGGNTTSRTKSGRKGDPNVLKTLGDSIVKELGSEIGLLAQLVPEVGLLFPSSSIAGHHDVDDNFNYEAGQERWKYSFRMLTRILSSQFSPLVFVFDDLQWSDEASLELIDILISDVLNPNPLMIIGCYRSNEIDCDHVLSLSLDNLKAMQGNLNFNLTELELGNLPLEGVHRIVSELLCSSDSDGTIGLAEICLKRTHGNPFFVIEFMTMLQQEELLIFNLGLLKWVWDEVSIENETMSTENVLELLLSRMKKLPRDVQQLLQLAACLGSNFKLSILDHIWTELAISDAEGATKKIQSLIAVLEEGNFIENSGPNEFRWVHDRVQEVALSLGRAPEDSFQFEVGTALYHALTVAEIDDLVFEIANLINKGNAKRRLEFAELNLKAAERARKISAFQAARTYVASGIQFLPNDAWSANRDLTLRLYSIGAEMELALGQTEQMETYMELVLNRKDCSTVEKFPLHMSKVYKLCTVDLKYNDTIDYCLSVLKELDCKMVFSNALLPVQAISSLTRTIKMAKKLKTDDYRNLKVMTDPKHQATMLLAQRLTIACYLQPSNRNSFLMIVCLTRMVQITLKHGVGPLAGPAFATLGLLAVAAMSDFESAAYFCEMALLLQQRSPSKYTSAITLFNSHSSVLAWVLPIQSCLNPISQAYTHGRQSGNTEQAMWALQVYSVWMPFQMGRSLESILSECPDIAFQSKEVQQNEQETFLKIFWQMMLNLAGQSENTTKLQGEVFDCDTFVSKTDLQDALFHLAQLELYIFFGDFDKAAKLALKRGDRYEKVAPGYFLGMMETFHRGVALYAMAQRTKKRQYKTAAKGILKTMTKWVKSGNPNVKQYQLLLLAEQSALDKKYKVAEKYYHDAFVLAGRTGHLHDAALFAERHSEFLYARKQQEEADYQRGESIRFYQAWGAKAKVDQMLASPLSSNVKQPSSTFVFPFSSTALSAG